MAEVTEILLRARMEVSDVISKVGDIQKGLKGLTIPKGIADDLEKSFGKLGPLLKDYQKQLNKGFSSDKDLKSFTLMRGQINDVFDEIKTKINEVNSSEIRVKTDVQAITKMEQELDDYTAKLQKNMDNIYKIGQGQSKNSILEDIKKLQDSINPNQFSSLSKEITNIFKAFKSENFADFNRQIDSVYNHISKLSDTSKLNLAEKLGLKFVAGDAKSAETALGKFFSQMQVNKTAANAIEDITKKIKELVPNIEQAKLDAITNGLKELESAGGGIDTVADSINRVGTAGEEAGSSILKMQNEMKQLQQSTQYFFSLRNMINLFKRGVREAVEVVKDLDAAMTETAVVTKYSVGDMWGKLPEYTANANTLGATVLDMYKSTTLYYQQGLNTQQAMSIATETMKMARIAGLEAADATDMMTAALRGFNMEINETSAEHINDVYSNLAAKTASNTEELGTAMQRTASIAHSAGMSFEGTAAFLAQAIETTREPAENLGTAMKTIVARFQELKKNPLEITEVDGEEVSYNKVDAALQSIGVSLKDANGQFRDLDKVFLDISKRWDSLSQTQQRYVATMAAGSRQQSRFIAMMSNYDRTMELMSYANNSAGASQEQFGKTLESLQAKINKLTNAWQQFLMGIANEKIIKTVVDGATKGLTLISKIIDKITKFDPTGISKSLLSLFTAFKGLQIVGKGINTFIGKAAGWVSPTAPVLGAKTSEAGVQTRTAATITNPIIAAIREVTAAINRKNGIDEVNQQHNSQVGTLQQYRSAQSNIRNLLGFNEPWMARGVQSQSIKYSDITGALKELGPSQQKEIIAQFPGLQKAMQSSIANVLQNKGLSAQGVEVGNQIMSNIINGMNKGTIDADKGIELLKQPQLWAERFAGQFDETVLKEIQSLAGKIDLGDSFQYENYHRLGDTVGKVGSKFATAGQSVQQFGLFLSNIGFEGIGNTIMRIGTAVSSLGMTFNGLGKAVTAFGTRWAAANKAMIATKKANDLVRRMSDAGMQVSEGFAGSGSAGMAWAKEFLKGIPKPLLAAGIAAAIVGGLLLIKNHIEKKAQEAGQEVRENFEKGFTEKSKTIDSLNSYEDRFNELSKGVDQFGHNINLSNEEYDEYLEISRNLQELSPSLIAGYNAEGEAILKKGEALKEVIKQLENEKAQSLTDYISNDSVDKLIKEYKTSDTYKDNRKKESKDGEVTGAFNKQLRKLNQASSKIKDGFNVADAIEQLGGGEVSSLSNLTTAQMIFVSQHYNDILNLIKEKNGELDESVEEGLKEAFSNVDAAYEDVMTEGQPIVEAMQRWMSAEGLDAAGLELGDEFGNSFTKGFNAIMAEGLTEGWTSDEFKANLKDYSTGWKALAGETSKYNEILSEADELQQDYLDHIGEDGAMTNYQDNVEGLAISLEELAEQYEGTGTAGDAFAEQCIIQANALRNYATEGALSLGEALNQLSGKFAEARDAKERFDKAVEGGDYYTAAEDYRSIAETVMDEKNWAGDGSLTGWAGAEELLGRAYVDTHSWEDIKGQIKEVNKLFDEGIEGVYNFNDMLVEAWKNGKIQDMGKVTDGAFEFDFENVENLKAWAEELEISEGVLSAMIDKSRQFAAFNVGNNKEIRRALEQTNEAMVGKTPTSGKSALYVSESYFYEEARKQGIRGNDYTKTIADLEKEQNIKFLTVESLSTKEGFDSFFEDIGFSGADKTLDNVVNVLSRMGFDLEDTKRILNSDGVQLQDGAVSDEAIEKAYKEQEFEVENPTVAGIADDTGVIASAATAMLAQMGIMTEQAKKDIENNTSNDTIKGYTDLLGQNFTNVQDREAARASAQAKRDEYQKTIDLYAEGGLNEDNNEYIKKLVEARNQLDAALANEANSWHEKISEYSGLFDNISDKFVSEHTADYASAFAIDDIMQSAEALRQLNDEGHLSYESIRTLAAEFMQLHQAELMQFDSTQLDELTTKLGLTKNEAIGLLSALDVPFALEGRLTGDDLVTYIQNFEGLTDSEKTIFLRTDISGEEKAELLIDKINNEFGDGDETTKSVIIQATTALANGDQAGAEKILADAGFKDGEVQEITQKLSILVDGSVANPDEVKAALQKELNSLQISTNVKANISTNIGKIGTKVNVDTGAIDDAKNKADSTTGTMTVDANTQKAQDKINKLRDIKDASITVNAKKGTGWTQTMSVKLGHARGRNYSIPAHQSLSFGAAASGFNTSKSYKSSGSKVTALVGEEGFEVGYIPSQARSLIFGANGPEITSFPKDTIIYPHKQSKEIVRRGKGKTPTMGSFISGTLPSRVTVTSYSSSGSSKSKNSGGSKSSASESKKTINNFSIEEVIRFDIDQTLAKLNSDINKKAKEIEKSLTKIGGVYDDIADSVNKQIQALQQVKVNNQALVDSYIRQLKAIDEGTYEQSISWTDSNGDSQEAVYNLSKYIYKDAAGTYKVDYDKIKALGSNAEREAVFKAANSAISSLQSGLLKAQEAVDDANEKMAELGKKVSETFYQWENELTEIYDLTQRINDETSFTNRFVSQVELELSKLNAGFGQTEKAIENTRKVLTRNNDTIQRQIVDQKQMIAARQHELNLMLSAADEQEKLNKYQNMTDIDEATKTANIEWAQDKVTVAETALKYVANVFRDLDGSVTYEIDWASFNADNDQSPMNKETYAAVKKYLDDLNSAATEFNNSVKEQTDFIKQTYDALRQYQDHIVDMESTLVKGVEEQIENAKNNAKALSDSITNALKDLLDEVKRKLDERRKQEDNAKTERDIAQKQQRLAALRANTSGGNQVEIAQLEKEIADAQQSYGRTLEDQLLDRLQQQGDEAAKQRERQIELMEMSNRTEVSTNKELVDMWLKNPQAYKDKIKEAWLEAQGYADKGEAGQYVLDNEFESKFTELITAVEQSGFNNLEAPFTAIEGNTNTLVALLQKLTSEENNAVQDATERNTEILKDLTKDVEGAKKAYSKGVDAKTLKDKFGFDATILAGGGYTPSDLRRAGFGVGDLVNAGITDVKTLKDAGFNDATAIKTALGETNAKGISDYKSAGFTAKDLKGLFNDADIIELFDAKELKDAQFAASALKNKFNVSQLKDAGYDLPTLGKVFSASEFGAGGISYADAKAAGFTAQQLKNVTQYAKQAAAELQPKVSQGRDLAYGSQGSDVKLLQQTLNKLGIRDNSGNSLDVDGDFGQHTREAVINFQKKYRNKASKTLSADGVVGYYTKEAFKALGYKTGGLADYTGPAWLDGTPSKPELVLNAADTKNFLALRDVLSSAMKSTSAVNNSYGGDVTYEVNINVDKLTSDYDVDKVADRVKKIIVKDAGYRNVTQVRNFR